MKTIIIDSGSTKADVAVIEKYNVEYYTQEGINTRTLKSIPISEQLKNDIAEADQIHYYGAGCETETDQAFLTSIFKEYNVAIEVAAHSDMLGACRATAGQKSGIVSILGTGSNSCIYDGHDIVDMIPQFGYVMGDEGGGSYIGKLMLNDFFDGEMPDNLAFAFQKHYYLSQENVLEQLYQANNPSKFLASHVRFLDLIKGKWKKRILNTAFNDFIKKRIIKYSDYQEYDMYFVGSIAFHFEKRLRKVMGAYDLEIKSIEQKPIEKLVEYHIQKL